MKLVLCVALLASPLVVEAKPPPQPFAYKYGVKDGYSGDDFAKSENQDDSGYNAGKYNVNLPDGRVQFVTYHPDNYNGYVADVTYEGNFMPMHRSAAAARNMPGELLSSDVGALDFSGPALDSGAVDGRYWFFSQAAPVLTTHNKGDFLSAKPAGKDRKKKTGKTEKMMRSAVEGNIVSPVGGHPIVTSNNQQSVVDTMVDTMVDQW